MYPKLPGFITAGGYYAAIVGAADEQGLAGKLWIAEEFDGDEETVEVEVGYVAGVEHRNVELLRACLPAGRVELLRG